VAKLDETLIRQLVFIGLLGLLKSFFVIRYD